MSADREAFDRWVRYQRGRPTQREVNRAGVAKCREALAAARRPR